jgi:tRNA (mo5U34)-methyltransferase
MSTQEERSQLAERIAKVGYWYHKIELPTPDGDVLVTPGWAPIDAGSYAIPDDLTGKRVLDVGAWDGYWTWEALKRGAAEVVAIDDFSDTCGYDRPRKGWQTFDLCREEFGFTDCVTADRVFPHALEAWANAAGQVVQRGELSIYDLPDVEGLGEFDVVFCFGVLYHCRHPLLGLEKISEVCSGDLFIESAIADDYTPYGRGLVQGLRDRQMIAEFYPTHEYGNNDSNWWVPTLKCMAYMVQTAGFKSVELWRLTNNPKGVAQCRGFVWASKAEAESGQGIEPPPNVLARRQTAELLRTEGKLAAVMSVPRLGFEDNSSAILEALRPLHVPLMKVWGVFWGQCMERGLQTQIDAGADILLTIDNDGVFAKEDLQELLALMRAHPECDALVPLQVGRDGKGALATMRSKTGQRVTDIPREKFAAEIVPISTGHFGLTLIRTSAILKMPHPWFHSHPDRDGQWGRDKIDEDIHFWRLFAHSGNQAYLAPRVTIGHIEAVVAWPSKDMQPVYQPLPQWRKHGKPANVWQ